MIETLERGLVDVRGRPLRRVGSRLLTIDDWASESVQRHALSPTVRAAKRAQMMDGPFWLDHRNPFISADCASVTLATTDKALYAVKDFPVLGGNYFNAFIGKAIAIWMFGGITTAATPGNGTVDIYWGNGTDANGTIIRSSAAKALSASQTDFSWWAELIVRSRTLGTTGTLAVSGKFIYAVSVMASTLQPHLVPDSGTIVSASVDLTLANIVSVQYKRSGSTAETMQIRELAVLALN